MRDRPQVESHFSCYQCVGVVEQVDVAPGEGTVLLQKNTRKMMHKKMITDVSGLGL